jgi:hypothetical protein
VRQGGASRGNRSELALTFGRECEPSLMGPVNLTFQIIYCIKDSNEEAKTGKSSWIVSHKRRSSTEKYTCTRRLRIARIMDHGICGYYSSTTSGIWFAASPLNLKNHPPP